MIITQNQTLIIHVSWFLPIGLILFLTLVLLITSAFVFTMMFTYGHLAGDNIHICAWTGEVLATVDNPLECGNDENDAKCSDTVV